MKYPLRLIVASRIRIALLAALACNLILYAIALAVYAPQFETNDDTAMCYIAAGVYTGHPNYHLIFTNVLIGFFLKVCFSLSHTINWYGLYLIGCQFLAACALCWLMLRVSFWFIFIYLIFFIVCLFKLYVSLQFTSTAGLCGIAGIMLLYFTEARMRPFHLPTWGGIGLIVLCGLIRIDMLKLILICSLPLFICGVYRNRKLLAPLLAAMTLSLICWGGDSLAYKIDPAWRTYREYNLLRGEFHGVPRQPAATPQEYDAKMKQVGWTYADLRMLGWFCFYDKPTYTLDSFKTYLRLFPAGSPSWLNSYTKAYTLLLAEQPYISAFVFLFALALLLPFVRKKKLMLATWIGVLTLACSTWLVYKARLPERIILPMFLLPISFMTLGIVEDCGTQAVAKPWLRNLIRSGVTALYASLLWMAWPAVVAIHYQSNSEKQPEKVYDATLESMAEKPFNSSSIFVVAGNGLLMENQSPLRLAPVLRHLNLLCGGWLLHSPLYDESLQRFGITNLIRDLGTMPNIFCVMRPDLLNQPPGELNFAQCLDQRFGLHTEVAPVNYGPPDAQTSYYAPVFKFHYK